MKFVFEKNFEFFADAWRACTDFHHQRAVNHHMQSSLTLQVTDWCEIPHFIFFRVRLVERGSPHSLPLMESGKVTQIHIKTAEKEKYICLQS